MFGFGHAGTSTSVDTEAERDPPPPATIVYFPQNDIDFESTNTWLKSPPDLYTQYAHLAKPADVKLANLAALNLTVKNDTRLEAFVPQSSDGLQHLPPKTWGPQREEKLANSATYEVYAHSTYPLLSNGTRAPDLELFNKFVKELLCNTDDGLRLIGKRKPRPGHPAPNFASYRKFWNQLETVASYWDTSLDNYYDIENPALKHHSKGLRGKLQASSRRGSVDTGHKTIVKYKGRRTSNGARMPEHCRNDVVRSFIEPIAWAFGTTLANPRRVPQLQIKNLLVPVTQTAITWRTPQDKGQIKRGVLEGPLLGIQCRAETTFVRDTRMAVIDAAREIAGLFLLAQERAREGKTDVIPGEGKWYTTKPRWGGGPGGEFGEKEDDEEGVRPAAGTPGRRHSAPEARPSSAIYNRIKDEQVWKELKPGPGFFEPRITYLAVGKERTAEYDSVFMVSSLYHHISILRLDVHPVYLEFLTSGHIPKSQPNSPWYAPTAYRTRWFDLLDGEDRAEAMRGIWGVMSYMMRTGQTSAPLGHRQKSEIGHTFHFRKKHHVHQEEDGATEPARSSSVTF